MPQVIVNKEKRKEEIEGLELSRRLLYGIYGTDAAAW